MTSRREARCQCGQLKAVCAGDPVRVSVCHCHDCQRRSGSVFAAQARFKAENIDLSGETRTWERTGDTGNVATFHFCPNCGSTVFYLSRQEPGLVAVAIGAFADGAFPQPDYSVYEGRKQAWVQIVGEGIDHFD